MNNVTDPSGQSFTQARSRHMNGLALLETPFMGTESPIYTPSNGNANVLYVRDADIKTRANSRIRAHTRYSLPGQITINDVDLVMAGCAFPTCHAPVTSTITNGTLAIKPWTKTQTVDGTVIQAIHGAVTSITPTDDTINYLTIASSVSNSGVQEIVNVEPGAPMGATFDVWTTSIIDEFYITVVGTNEKILASTTPVTVAASTWTTITLPSFTLPAVLVDNQHMPLDPPILAQVEVQVAGDDSAVPSIGETVAVSLQEWLLDPSELTLEAGTYTFDASNDGSIAHALVLEGQGISAGTPDAAFDGGISESFTVDLAPGTYEISCPVPGHKEAGMVGIITVSG